MMINNALLRFGFWYSDLYDARYELIAIFRARYYVYKFLESSPRHSRDIYKIIDIYDNEELQTIL